MVQRKKSGDVISTDGKVDARRIVTGIDNEGVASDAVLKAALEMMERWSTGDVKGAKGVTAREEIVTGLRYVNPQSPDRESLLAEMKALREMVAKLQKEPPAAAETEAAGRSLDEAIAEAEKDQPLGKMVANRLRDTVEFLTDAGKLWEAAGQAGPLIAQAVATAVMLYQIAGKVF